MPSSSDSEVTDAILISSKDVRDFNEANILPVLAEDLIKIREWLQPTPYDQEKRRVLSASRISLGGNGQVAYLYSCLPAVAPK